MKHLLKLLDCTPEEITSILDLADQLKYERKHHNFTSSSGGQIHWSDFPEVIHPYQSFL